jgi:EAL domain-containing protein (putative c-di-GMP-specific phosphodiesterase class I)
MLGVQKATFATVGDVIDARAVTTVFQPLVRLDSAEVVGFEALSRGPAGTPWEAPMALFAAARDAGRLAELDWICRASAYRTAIEGELPDGVSLFVNAEPSALSVPCPPDLAGTILAAQLRLRVVTEMTERSIAHDPAALLAAAAACRGSGWGVALDDVGADPASLALMPFIHPDVVKLDLHLVQHPEDGRTASVVNAVIAYAERTGAAVLAEGIETPGHLAAARSMGATLGQGWRFGHPGPLPSAKNLRRPHRTVPFVAAPSTSAPPSGGSARTPYEIVSARRPTTECTKRLLLPTSHYLEAKATDRAEPPILLACFQEGRHFTRATARRFARYAETAAMVAAIATDLPSNPVPGVRGAALTSDDPLCGEWNVIVVGPHFAGALVARDLGDDGDDAGRRFAYALTYDRELVLEAARALLHWVVPT